MNYLELCQAVVREGAITPGDGKPSTVKEQTGRMRLVADWVNRANKSIQSERNDFSFRVREVDFNVDPTDDYLRLIDTHSDIESINEMTASVRNEDGTRLIAPVPWRQFRYDRLYSLPKTEGLPTQYSYDTAGDIHLIPRPVNPCIFRCEVKLGPQIMTEDTDVPYIPVQYHDVIVYRALMYFYEYDESQIQLETATRHYGEWMDKLVSATTELSGWHKTQTGESLMVITCD